MSVSPALPLAVSLLSASVLAATGRHLGRVISDVFAVGSALAVGVLCALLALQSAREGRVITWFGGWTPVAAPGGGKAALGICFAVDPFGGAMAAFAALLIAVGLAYASLYFDSAGRLFHVLMLTLLAGMVGFCLTGDLFDLFVFFELFSVSAWALTGFRIEQRGPIQGAINFAVVNTVGSYLMLLGIGLLYGHTRALNLAQLGQALAGQPMGPAVLAGLTLIAAGLATKASLFPFHFWLPDAYAVVPAPIALVFGGILVELGLFGMARVYWTAFAGIPGLEGESFFRLVMAAAVLTALWGAGMALLEADLKRRLAFVTMCHGGIVLTAFAKRSPEALAGGAVYVLADGLAKAALFAVAGILLDRFGSEALDRLHGRGKGMWLPGLTFVLGGLALTGCPPFGTALGREALQQASSAGGIWWLEKLGTVAEIIAGVAVLGAAGRIFLGWGSAALPATGAQGGPAEEAGEEHASPAMTVLCVFLIAGSLAVGLWPGVIAWAKAGARTFTDSSGYAQAVLLGARIPQSLPEGLALHIPTAPSAWLPTLIALLLTGLGALRGRFMSRVREAVIGLLAAPLRLLRGLQSGLLADYVVWTCLGTVTLYVCLRVWMT